MTLRYCDAEISIKDAEISIKNVREDGSMAKQRTNDCADDCTCYNSRWGYMHGVRCRNGGWRRRNGCTGNRCRINYMFYNTWGMIDDVNHRLSASHAVVLAVVTSPARSNAIHVVSTQAAASPVAGYTRLATPVHALFYLRAVVATTSAAALCKCCCCTEYHHCHKGKY